MIKKFVMPDVEFIWLDAEVIATSAIEPESRLLESFSADSEGDEISY